MDQLQIRQELEIGAHAHMSASMQINSHLWTLLHQIRKIRRLGTYNFHAHRKFSNTSRQRIEKVECLNGARIYEMIAEIRQKLYFVSLGGRI